MSVYVCVRRFLLLSSSSLSVSLAFVLRSGVGRFECSWIINSPFFFSSSSLSRHLRLHTCHPRPHMRLKCMFSLLFPHHSSSRAHDSAVCLCFVWNSFHNFHLIYSVLNSNHNPFFSFRIHLCEIQHNFSAVPFHMYDIWVQRQPLMRSNWHRRCSEIIISIYLYDRVARSVYMSIVVSLTFSP